MVNPRKPHFLEVFLPALCSDRLKVPTRFTKYLAGTASGTLLLTGPSEDSWHVDLIERNGHLFLDEGWPAFVKDHAIECGDSLVFCYDRDSHFTVQIFDQSSCEKEGAFQAKCSQGESYIDRCLFGKKREREREASISNPPVEKKAREGELVPLHLDVTGGDMDECERSDCHWSVVLGLPSFSDSRDILAVMSTYKVHDPVHMEKACSKKLTKKGFSKKAKKKKKEPEEKKNSVKEFIEARAAHYFTSDFPYFVRVMNRSNIFKGSLKVPVKFGQVHLPSEKTKVILRNLDGQCWVLNLVPTPRIGKQSKMYNFCGGWSAFVRSNGIKMEDVCIFELVDELELRVHILRLSLEGFGSQALECGGDNGGVKGPDLPLEVMQNDVEGEDEVHYAEIAEETGVLKIENNVVEDGNCEEEAEYFVDLSEYFSPLQTLGDPAPLLLSEVDYESTDYLLGNSLGGPTSFEMGARSGEELYSAPFIDTRMISGDEKAALSFTSPYPRFMKVITSSNIAKTLHVPNDFSCVHLCTQRAEIVLRNMVGNSWSVTANRYGSQTIFCKGWTSFVRDNVLKAGDICIFELVDDRVFQVHVFEPSQTETGQLESFPPACNNNNNVVVEDDSIATTVFEPNQTETGQLESLPTPSPGNNNNNAVLEDDSVTLDDSVTTTVFEPSQTEVGQLESLPTPSPCNNNNVDVEDDPITTIVFEPGQTETGQLESLPTPCSNNNNVAVEDDSITTTVENVDCTPPPLV